MYVKSTCVLWNRNPGLGEEQLVLLTPQQPHRADLTQGCVVATVTVEPIAY